MDKDQTTSPLDVEDTEALERSIASLRSLGGEEINLVLGELDRLRGKFDDINDGKTVLIMSDADRATRVQDLDDASLAAWSRWVFLNMERVRKRMETIEGISQKDEDPMTLGAMQGVIGLALLTFGAGNSHLSFETKGVSFGNLQLGDWKVDIFQQRKANGEPTRSKEVPCSVLDAEENPITQVDLRPFLCMGNYADILALSDPDDQSEKIYDVLGIIAHYDDEFRNFVFDSSKPDSANIHAEWETDNVLSWIKDHRPDAWFWINEQLEEKGKS